MKNDLLKIINTYGVLPQLKYFYSEVYELSEAIINAENYEPEKGDIFGKINCNVNTYVEHIAEEIADVTVMLRQFQYYYGREDKDINDIMISKIDRQLNRIKENK